MATTVESTTDTPAEVQVAASNKRFGARAVETAPVAEKPADKKPETKVEAAASVTEPEVEEIESEEPEETESTDRKIEGSDDKEAVPQAKKKGGFQKKIDKMTKVQKQMEADIAALRAEKEAWIAGQKSVQQKVEAPPASALKQAEGKPNKDQFKTQEEYIEALTDWKLDQRAKESETKAQTAKIQTEREKMISDHNSRTQEFRESTPDFQEVLSEVDHIPFTPAMADIILSNEQGPAIMYALAKDPENYERISKLSPLAMAREIGKIEAKLDVPSKTKNQTSTKKTTSAPAPVRSVSGSPVVPKKTLEQAAESSFDAYRAARLSGAKLR